MSAKSVPRKATYEDVLRAPENMVAEIVDGELNLSPRPARPHALASMRLGSILEPAFGRGSGGPGGWVILFEPELHLGAEPAILVPDIAGWRAQRLPPEDGNPFFITVPDWLCETLSPSTARFDRLKKLPLYASLGVRHAWVVDPLQRTLEILRNEQGKWLQLAIHADEAKVRAEPFDAIELDLSLLWADAK